MAELKMPFICFTMVSGRFVADPFAVKTKDASPGASFTIACNRYSKGKPTVTTFVDCIAWNDNAKIILERCTKGSPVIVTGSLANRDKANGKSTVKVLQLSVGTVQFLWKEEEAPAA